MSVVSQLGKKFKRISHALTYPKGKSDNPDTIRDRMIFHARRGEVAKVRELAQQDQDRTGKSEILQNALHRATWWCNRASQKTITGLLRAGADPFENRWHIPRLAYENGHYSNLFVAFFPHMMDSDPERFLREWYAPEPEGIRSAWKGFFSATAVCKFEIIEDYVRRYTEEEAVADLHLP